MSDIDPRNLGAPVYKADQCITIPELREWALMFKSIEVKFHILGMILEAKVSNRMAHLIGDMQVWVRANKPVLKDFDPNRYRKEMKDE